MTVPNYSQEIRIAGELLQANGDPSDAIQHVDLFDAQFYATKQPVESGFELSLEPTGPNTTADDRDVLRMLCAPMGIRSVGALDASTQLRRLVNSQSILFKRLEASELLPIPPIQVQENIHALLDVLETGDILGWKSAPATACLPEALANRCFALIPETPLRELQTTLNMTPDVPQPIWHRLNRLSPEDRHLAVRKWHSELPRAKQELFYQEFVRTEFIEVTCGYQDGLINLFIPRRQLPDDVTEGQIHQVRLPASVDIDAQGLLTTNIFYRVAERYHYGVPVLRWRKDHRGNREFVIQAPQEHSDAEGDIVYRENLLGAVMLANLVSGAYSRTEINPATDDRLESEKVITLGDEFKATESTEIARRAAILPFMVMSKQSQVLSHRLVSNIETLLFTGA